MPDLEHPDVDQRILDQRSTRSFQEIEGMIRYLQNIVKFEGDGPRSYAAQGAREFGLWLLDPEGESLTTRLERITNV